jgi:hypothetical protein
VRERKPSESFQDYVISILWETGRLFTVPQASLGALTLRDQVVIEALIDLSKFHAREVAARTLQHHGRLPVFDGQVGPAMTDFLLHDIPSRCPVPDYAPPKGVVFQFADPAIQEIALAMQEAEPALGVGNWKSCHRVKDAHCATVMVNPANMPGHVQPVFKDVLRLVQKAYADVGLLFRFLDESRKDILTGEVLDVGINIDMSFVRSSDGWIGLAIVGTNQTCGSRIWCRFLASYQGGTTPQAITQQWVSLIKHELGHNCGFSHTAGGVMNPSLINGLPHEWAPNDPTTPKLKQQFSGVPVPIPGSGGGPTPPKPPVGDVQAQIDDLNLRLMLQEIQVKWLVANRK